MKKHWIISLVAVFLALIAIAVSVSVFIKKADKTIETADEITVTFSEQGFSQKVTEVRIDSYAKNLEAGINYCLVNKTGYDIEPSIIRVFDVNPDDYSVIEGQGYKAVPDYYQDWIDIPSMGMISENATARYTIKLKIPGSYEGKVPNRWAFQTVARSGTGGMYQVAPAVWWLVNMR